MKLTPHLSDYDIVIGLDVDRKSYAATYRDCAHEGRSLKMPANPKALFQHFQKRFPNKRLLYIYEAGPTGYHLHDYIENQGQTCMVVNAASVPHASNDFVKTNRLDSQSLVEQCQSGRLRGIRVPTEIYRQLRHLVSLRQQYTEDQQQAKQRIKALLLFESIKLPEIKLLQTSYWSARFIESLKQASLPQHLRFKLDLLLEDLMHARGRLLLIHGRLRELCRNEEPLRNNISYLRSIPGIGFVVSIHALARIGDPVHLKNIRELGSFFGVVPTERSTGDQIRRGSITHMGNSYLRGLLVEAAWAAIRKDTELRQFYDRIRTKRRGETGSKIAIVAVARKLSHRIYRVLKEQRFYVTH